MSLKLHPKRIESGDEAKKLPGIGKKIAKKIDEILSTGQLERLENDLNDPSIQAVNLVSRVNGVGPKLAKKLVHEDGIRSLDDMRQKASTFNNQIQLGLKYFDDLEKKIPRDEMVVHEKLLLETAARVSAELVVQVCGSFRRGLGASGDIDCLIMHPQYGVEQKDSQDHFPAYSKFVKALCDSGYIVDTMSRGPSKLMGMCKLDDTADRIVRRIDLKLFPVESFWCALLHFTGSGEHNRQLRALALEKHYKLSEYGMYPLGTDGKVGDPLPISCEEDVFGILGVPFRTPQQRSF